MTAEITKFSLAREHEIKSEFNEHIIKLTEVDIAGRTVETILKLKDQAIREALEKLGWLPPEVAEGIIKECDEVKSHVNQFLDAIDCYQETGFNEVLDRVVDSTQHQSLVDHDKVIAKQAFIQGFLVSGEGYNGEIECGEAPESLIEQAKEYAESLSINEDVE